ncbi:hypothetical protein JW905_04790 [bacterium]|nr:hypothetical protein [candidate division CSSED10-310 bacterium]
MTWFPRDWSPFPCRFCSADNPGNDRCLLAGAYRYRHRRNSGLYIGTPLACYEKAEIMETLTSPVTTARGDACARELFPGWR